MSTRHIGVRSCAFMVLPPIRQSSIVNRQSKSKSKCQLHSHFGIPQIRNRQSAIRNRCVHAPFTLCSRWFTLCSRYFTLFHVIFTGGEGAYIRLRPSSHPSFASVQEFDLRTSIRANTCYWGSTSNREAIIKKPGNHGAGLTAMRFVITVVQILGRPHSTRRSKRADHQVAAFIPHHLCRSTIYRSSFDIPNSTSPCQTHGNTRWITENTRQTHGKTHETHHEITKTHGYSRNFFTPRFSDRK